MHFTVLVAGDDVAGQLAPFQEDTGMDTYPEKYLEFAVRIPREEVKDYIKKSLDPLSDKNKAEYSELPDGQIMAKFGGYTSNKNGDYGFMINPNAEWDWWVIGGRWRGYFKLKPGRNGAVGGFNAKRGDIRICPDGVDQARKGDIDFEGSYQARLEEAERNWSIC